LGDTANFKDDINEDKCEDVESELKSDTETSNGVNITLKNGTTIKQRKSFGVIRYARFNKKKTMQKFVIVNVWIDEVKVMKHMKPCTKVFKDLWTTKQDHMNTMQKNYRELRSRQNMTRPILMKLHQAHNKPNLRIWKKGQLILYYIYLLILIAHQNTRPSI
jgi:quinol monooxygenase YgiN